MKEIGQYNTELYLFKEVLPPTNLGRLRFWRWTAEQRLDGRALNPSGGEFAFAAAIKSDAPIEELPEPTQEKVIGQD